MKSIHARRTAALSAAALAALSSAICAPSAHAADFIWDNDTTDFSWITPANWDQNAAFPNATSDTAAFNGAAPGAVSLNGAQTVGTLTFSGSGYGVVSGAGGSLTIDNGAGGGTVTHSAGINSVNAPLTMGAGTTLNVTGGTLFLGNSSLVGGNNLTGATVNVAPGATLNAGFGATRPGAPGPSGTNSLGGATVALAGGTLILAGAAYDGGAGGVTGQYYNQQVQRNAQIEFRSLSAVTALFNTSTPETTTGGYTDTVGTIDYGNTTYGTAAAFNVAGGPGAPNPGANFADNVMATWRGKFIAPTTTTYTFGGNGDDGVLVYVDGQLVVNKPNFGGASADAPGGTIALTAGQHDIFVAYYEGGGGAGVRVYENDPAAAANAAASDLLGDPLDLADLVAAQPQTTLGNNVNWTGTATIAADNTYGVTMGTLNANTAGQTLTTGRTVIAGQGSPDGLVRFTGTTFGAGGTFTLNTLSDLALGTLTDGANTVTLSKTGSGNLILDSSAVADANGTTFDVQAGRLVASSAGNTGNNPLGTSVVQLNGANTILQLNLTEANNANRTFDNALAVNQDARVEMMNHSGTTRELTLGGATNGITIAPGRTLEIAVTNAVTGRVNAISGAGANVRVSSANDAGQQQGFLLMNAANTFTGRLTIDNGANLRIDHVDAVKTQSVVDLAGGGRLEFFAAGSMHSTFPLLVSRPASVFRLNNAAFIGAGVTLNVGPGRLTEIQTGAALTGAGTVVRNPGAYYLHSVANAVPFPTANTTVGMRAQDMRPLDVFRVTQTLNGAGDGVTTAGWGATPAGFVMQINGGNRTITNGALQEMNGQVITIDGASRTMNDGIRLDVAANGGTIAASSGFALTVAEDLQTTAASGKLNIGANVPFDSRFSNGTVIFAHGSAGDFTGTTASAAKAVSIIGGSVLEGRVSAAGSSGFGSNAGVSIGVALDRGTLRAIQPATAVNGAFINVGKIFATGAGTLHVSRNTGTAGTVTEMRLNDTITESTGATVGLQSQNNVLGGDERIRFATLAHAPARVGSVNMVSPRYVNVSGNLGAFADYDPAQDPTTGVGFTTATHTNVTTEAGLAGASTIADVTAAIVLTAPQTVGALRSQAGITGAFPLTVDTGGVILTSSAAVSQTIASPITAPAGTELRVYSGGVSGGIHNLNGALTSTAGLTKWGPRTLTLGADNSATLTGDITINEATLAYGADNRLGAPANRIVLNGGGFRPNANMTTARQIVVNYGGGQLTNDGNRTVTLTGAITGEGALTVNAVNGNTGVNQLQQPAGTPNTFAGGLIISNGTVEFTRDEQLGAVPSATDYDAGHIVINDATTNATLRLASGAGSVTTTGRAYSLTGTARIEVANVSDTLTIDGPTRGSGGLTKLGPGTLILSSAIGNGHSGANTVSAGVLVMDTPGRWGIGSGAVTVASGATLNGRGYIDGLVTASTGSNLSPGSPGVSDAVGELRLLGGATLAVDSNYTWSLASETTAGPGTNWDRTVLEAGTLAVTAGANLNFQFATGAEPSGDAFWASTQTWPGIFTLTGIATAGAIGAFDINNAPHAAFGSFSTATHAGGIDLIWSPVPEPTGVLTLGALGAGFALTRRRRLVR